MIRYEKLQYDFKREVEKIPALSSGKIWISYMWKNIAF